MTVPARKDLRANRTRIEQTDTLDAAVADRSAQLVGNRRNDEDIIGIGHRKTLRESASVARKVDARDEDRV
jgi:ABC-type uncharacterized transport system fused permease/ATPase subunit